MATTLPPPGVVSVCVLDAARPAPHDADDGLAWLRHGRVPGLDGLRAISIVLVLLAHAWNTAGFPLGAAPGVAHRLGSAGVDVFFVISGFLITLLLWRERERHGTVSLRAFYVRRAARILPAYLAFLAALLGLAALGGLEFRPGDWLSALTYTVNVRHCATRELEHIWSLSVEEQFYLLWPLLFLLPRRAGTAALGAALLVPLARLLLWAGGVDAAHGVALTLGRVDGLAAGCGLAFLAAHDGPRRMLLLPLTRRPLRTAAVLLAGLAVAVVVLPRSAVLSALFPRTAYAVALAGLVGLVVARPASLLTRGLEWAPVAWLGRLSYSLYLWQQPFLSPSQDAWYSTWPTNLGLALLCGVVSYYLIEAPILRLRERRGWGAVGRTRHTPAVPLRAAA